MSKKDLIKNTIVQASILSAAAVMATGCKQFRPEDNYPVEVYGPPPFEEEIEEEPEEESDVDEPEENVSDGDETKENESGENEPGEDEPDGDKIGDIEREEAAENGDSEETEVESPVQDFDPDLNVQQCIYGPPEMLNNSPVMLEEQSRINE